MASSSFFTSLCNCDVSDPLGVLVCASIRLDASMTKHIFCTSLIYATLLSNSFRSIEAFPSLRNLRSNQTSGRSLPDHDHLSRPKPHYGLGCTPQAFAFASRRNTLTKL